jgi:hypothetical protein
MIEIKAGGENNRPLPYSKSNKEWNKNDRK